MLRQKDETKNKNEKKITETEIETKTKELSDESGAILSVGKGDISDRPPEDLIKNQKFYEQKSEVHENSLLTF